jgi:prepilin-type N-terminal cleavage/methylation domain-containing protein/prepilin-type processing-associated H-X9-DG protein
MEKKGFTLIELLVVIAIIALLLAILMPALGKAKTIAQEVLCKSNLHQYQIATEMYTNENGDRMPDPATSLYSKQKFDNETERFCRWHNPEYNLEAKGEDTDGTPYEGPYWPYLSATKANVCPVFSKLAPKYSQSHMEGNGGRSASDCIGGTFVANFSYSMNRVFRINNTTSAKKTAVRSPSETFLWAEENMWTLRSSDSSRRLSNFVLNDNSLLVKEDGTVDGTDCFGSYHKISKGKRSIQQQGHIYNGGVANVLMADGSLTWVSPEDTWKYRGSL